MMLSKNLIFNLSSRVDFFLAMWLKSWFVNNFELLRKLIYVHFHSPTSLALFMYLIFYYWQVEMFIEVKIVNFNQVIQLSWLFC